MCGSAWTARDARWTTCSPSPSAEGWRTVKYENVYLSDYVTPKDAREGLTEYLAFYNDERPHQSLDYRTPADVYRSACADGQACISEPGEGVLSMPPVYRARGDRERGHGAAPLIHTIHREKKERRETTAT